MKAEEIKVEIMKRLAEFLKKSSSLRVEFDEHAREVDRMIYEVLRKLDCCNHPKCECGKSFEQFHREQNNAGEKLRQRIENYELI